MIGCRTVVLVCALSVATGLVCSKSLTFSYSAAYSLVEFVQKIARFYERERAILSIRVESTEESRSSGEVLEDVLELDRMIGFTKQLPHEPHEEMQNYPTHIAIPFAATNFVIPYNLQKVSNLTLSMQVLSAIFRGEIKNWNDDRIMSLAGNQNQPIQGPILTCVRSDDSGETFVLTKAFMKADKKWIYGDFSYSSKNKSESWPEGAVKFYGKAMTGVVGIVSSIPGVITYTSHGTANKFELPYAQLLNLRHKITPPTLQSLSQTMEYTYSRHKDSIEFDLMDSPFVNAYPLASFEYIILPTRLFGSVDCCLVREIVGLIVHVLTMETSFYEEHHKAKLPQVMINDLISFKVSRITCNGENMYDAYIASNEPKGNNKVYVIIGTMTGAIVITLAVAVVLISFHSYRKVDEEVASWIIAVNHLSADTRSSDSMISRAFNADCRAGTYQNSRVLMKEMEAMHPSKWSRKTKKLVTKWMKKVSKPNVLVPRGFTQIERYVFSVWEFPGKGTLHHTIVSTKFELDFDIKASVAMDIADGLRYLHEQGIVVGNMTCQNCYMDGGWTVKIGSWMDTAIYLSECPEVFASYYASHDEFLTLEDANRILFADPRGFELQGYFDKQSDIFSLGMLLFEIFTIGIDRDSGAELTRAANRKIKSRKAEFPTVQTNVSPKVTALIQQCTGDVEWRPSPAFVYKELRALRTRKRGIVDMLLENMEVYMNQLEEKIQRRTADLALQTTELQKITATMEGILFEVLPESVARKLIKNVRVEPEYFESVSIFFADVVGFTKISAQLSPAEVMEFLNELWLMFDDVASRFDVYKVDTIGDCYMIGSGLPKPNGTAHVKEVCGMGLHLLVTCPKLKVKKLGTSVLVRVGINSGPVIAGIVGTRMPQYCVFGDTVNTASRMESTSEPMRIQITAASAALLTNEYPEFQVQYRGLVELEGKGMQETYWLTGKPKSGDDGRIKASEHMTPVETQSKQSITKPRPCGMFMAEKLTHQLGQ